MNMILLVIFVIQHPSPPTELLSIIIDNSTDNEFHTNWIRAEYFEIFSLYSPPSI